MQKQNRILNLNTRFVNVTIIARERVWVRKTFP